MLEVEEAVKSGKLIVPVVAVEVPYDKVRHEVASRNWIFIRGIPADGPQALCAPRSCHSKAHLSSTPPR